MAKDSSVTQRKKRSRNLLILVGVLVVAAVVILFFGMTGGPEETTTQVGEVSEEVTSIKQEVKIPRALFENEFLEDGNFLSYELIQAPEEYGRNNPFSLFE